LDFGLALGKLAAQTDYDAMMAALISSFWADYVDHFATVCADNGLVVVE